MSYRYIVKGINERSVFVRGECIAKNRREAKKIFEAQDWTVYIMKRKESVGRDRVRGLLNYTSLGTKESKVVAVDFDGTLCREHFPFIGAPNTVLINIVKKFRFDGWQIILWTNREGDLLEKAVEWCKMHGLRFDAVNANIQWRVDRYGNDCRKIGADLYIDDKAINPTTDELALLMLVSEDI